MVTTVCANVFPRGNRSQATRSDRATLWEGVRSEGWREATVREVAAPGRRDTLRQHGRCPGSSSRAAEPRRLLLLVWTLSDAPRPGTARRQLRHGSHRRPRSAGPPGRWWMRHGIQSCGDGPRPPDHRTTARIRVNSWAPRPETSRSAASLVEASRCRHIGQAGCHHQQC